MPENINNKTPIHHIAFIMDGNGRWANKRGMPREYGHKVGAEAFERVIRYCGKKLGIENITVYAFSTENWKRPEKEVSAIMKLLDIYLDKALETLIKDDVRIIFIGDLSVFPDALIKRFREVEEKSSNNRGIVNVAINYGGRAEIVHAANELIKEGKNKITEADIENHLYTHLSPDPDLIVRTGGELRLSNFLLWQASYSEFYYTDTLWPDMAEADVDKAIDAFCQRKRRYGNV